MQGSSVTFISKGGSEEICGNDRVEDQSFFTETDTEYIGDQLADAGIRDRFPDQDRIDRKQRIPRFLAIF